MDLRQRLAQLDRLTQKVDPGNRGTAAPLGSPAVDRESVLRGLGLMRHELPVGPVWYLEHIDTLKAPAVGLPDLTGLFTADSAGPHLLSTILFLDTETTGLAGGTGTLVFQVGVSWWQSGDLHTRQYFLPGPADELALLVALAGLAEKFSLVVTFNGASFDLPLLRTRALLNRLTNPLSHLVSWDLLVPARRLWGNRLANCRQQTVEEHLCGCAREGGDIDGARIPQTWFDFLHSGEPGLLANVLTHNHRDMLGMFRIFGRVCQVATWLAAFENRACWPPTGLAGDRAGGWAVGRVCERRAAPAAAACCFNHAWAAGWGGLVDADQRQRFRRDAIRVLKRQRAWDLVEEMIHDGLECDGNNKALHTEAAILYEHRLVDLKRALEHAGRAGDAHRLARLERLMNNPG